MISYRLKISRTLTSMNRRCYINRSDVLVEEAESMVNKYHIAFYFGLAAAPLAGSRRRGGVLRWPSLRGAAGDAGASSRSQQKSAELNRFVLLLEVAVCFISHS
jgi:hypothetical protein